MSAADLILDAIDSALEDCVVSEDAMRWVPEQDREPEGDWATVSAASSGPEIDAIDLFLMGAAGLSPWPDAGLFTGFLQDEPRVFDVPTWYPWAYESEYPQVATWFSLDTDPLLLGYADGSHFRPGTLPGPEPGTIDALANHRVSRLLDAVPPSRRRIELPEQPVRKLTLPHPVEVGVTMPLGEHHARLAEEFARLNGAGGRENNDRRESNGRRVRRLPR